MATWSLEAYHSFRNELENLLPRESQRQHFWSLVRELIQEPDPLTTSTVDIVKISEQPKSAEFVYAMRDRLGLLRDIDLQVVFHLDPDRHRLILLAAFDHPDDKKLPLSLWLQLQLRLRAITDPNHSRSVP